MARQLIAHDTGSFRLNHPMR